ncbi:MAG: hypothetical protein ACRELY_29580 [Polyangiaceae bacterium]
MSPRSLVVYKYFLAVLAASAAIAALVDMHNQPALRKGSITTRWREGGDVVERCTSCHTDPHPAAAADVIAIHPIESYGCVACHGGMPGAGDLSAHDGLLTKTNDVDLGEAACGRCHASEERLTYTGKDLAPHLAKGRAVYESRCAPCHDANASHDRALPMSWMSSAHSPTSVMQHLGLEPATAATLAGDDPASREARKDVVAWLWSKDDARARGTANVPGSSREEGADIYNVYGCLACHGVPSSATFPAEERDDFVAYYMQNPQRVRASDPMPSFRLTKRGAASIAKLLSAAKPAGADDPQAALASSPAWRDAKAKCSADNDLEISHADCGAKIAAKLGCGSCHADAGPPAKAPDLTNAFAALSTSKLLPSWQPAHRELTDPDVRVALAAKMNAHVAPKFDPARAPYFETVPGSELLQDRGCLACHSRTSRDAKKIGELDAPRAKPPSLFREGAKVQPEWLLAFFRDPEANGVRPVLHPEWVWGELVPQDKMAVRMPTFALSNEETTAIVRALAKEDGGDYPYSNPPVPSLSSGDIVSALVHVNGEADNGGACMKCHYVGALPIDRAKTNLEMVAPDLGRVASRLRPKFVRDLLARPGDFVQGMPALWKDPAGPALAWTIPPDAEPKKTAAEQIALVSDFLYLLRDDTRLPRAGDETKTPILGLSHANYP